MLSVACCRQRKQTYGCLKGVHTCEIHTSITTVVQKIIVLIIYSCLCEFLCRYILLLLFQTFAVLPVEPVKPRSMTASPDTQDRIRFPKWIRRFKLSSSSAVERLVSKVACCVWSRMINVAVFLSRSVAYLLLTVCLELANAGRPLFPGNDVDDQLKRIFK